VLTPLATGAALSGAVLLLAKHFQKSLKQNIMKKKQINIEQQLLLEIKESIDRIEQLASEPIVLDREWLEPKDICAILNISRRTLADYSKKGYIPYSRLGGRVYYRLSDIDDYLSSHLIRKEPRS